MQEMQGEIRETQDKKSVLNSWMYDWAEALVSALIIIVLLFSFVMRISTVEGDSMVPTLHNKDILLISDLFYDPAPGDIVVADTNGFLDHPIVKRIIATEGQLVDIDIVTHKVMVDGQVLKEDYIAAPTKILYDVEFPLVVPKGCVFVMGDNRNESTDSRDSRVGCMDERQILGRVIFRVFPLNKIGLPK